MLNDDDIELDPRVQPFGENAAAFEEADLRPAESDRVLFMTNKAGRLVRFARDGVVDRTLLDQICLG